MCDKKLYNQTQLLKRLSNSDPSAFRELYDHYRNRIFTLALQLLKTESLAEDTIQEVFIKLWMHKEKLPEIDYLNAFVNTITRNHIFNQLKKIAYTEQFAKEAEHTSQVSDHSFEQEMERKQLYSLLTTAVNNLSPQQKKVY